MTTVLRPETLSALERRAALLNAVAAEILRLERAGLHPRRLYLAADAHVDLQARMKSLGFHLGANRFMRMWIVEDMTLRPGEWAVAVAPKAQGD